MGKRLLPLCLCLMLFVSGCGKNDIGESNGHKVSFSAMDTYINKLANKKGDDLPYPLLRNHIYRFTLTGASKAKTRANGDIDDISITSEVLQTSDIDFSQQVKQVRLNKINNTLVVKDKR